MLLLLYLNKFLKCLDLFVVRLVIKTKITTKKNYKWNDLLATIRTKKNVKYIIELRYSMHVNITT